MNELRLNKKVLPNFSEVFDRKSKMIQNPCMTY